MPGKHAAERIVIVGASLAGLRAAQTLREEGFGGDITVVGDEADPPYDRPPLSKQVLSGWVPPDHTFLADPGPPADIHWLLGTPAAGLDRPAKEVVLADDSRIPYDVVLIATGVRNRPWPDSEQAGLTGVCGVRTRGDAANLAGFLAAGVRRVVAVIALGAIRNTEWLADSGLAAGPLGVSADAGCRAIAVNGLVTDDVFVAGDVARFAHALFDYQFLALEHWENAVVGAQVAAHNMVCLPEERRPHACVPVFWSTQFDVNIKSVGVPSLADEIVITQGSTDNACFAAAYGNSEGQIVAAVTFNHGRWLDHYRRLIERASPLPGPFEDGLPGKPERARFPHPAGPYHGPTVVVTGHSPTEMDAIRVPAGGSAP